MLARIAPISSLFALLLIPLASVAQDVVPQYKLEGGQEIQYDAVSDDKSPQSTSHQETIRTLWVLARNGDGSWQVLERDASRESETAQGPKVPVSRSEELLSYAVFPDGKVVPDEAKGVARHSLFVFPRLPVHSTDKAWRSDYPDGHTDFAVLAGRASASRLVFRFEEHTLDNDIYLASHAGIVQFDPERGLLVEETSESSMDYGFHVKTTASSRLKSVATKDPAFTRQLARESRVYFKAVDDYGHAETSASRNGLRGEAIMKRAGDDLRRARSEVTLPMFAAPLDKMLSRHDHIVGYFKQEAEHIAGLIGKPAADWTLKDLNGQSHSLADYRGKVVLLDFWYRGCGWCTKAMPEMEKVADDFKNDPVVLLGMNTDRDEKDARFVAEKMHLNYTTLLARGIDKDCGVRAFPTFILIDSNGIVRDVASGYSPHMREELGQAIRNVLPGKSVSMQQNR